MFAQLKRRLGDARTLARLCTTAEEIARRQGRARPGSEHFVLAALALPDETARAAFERLKLTQEAYLGALAAQRSDALASVGVDAPPGAPSDLPPAPQNTLYQTEPSGQSLVQRLADTRHARQGRPLVGADVLLAAADERFTPSMRAFHKLGVNPAQLAETAAQTTRAATSP